MKAEHESLRRKLVMWRAMGYKVGDAHRKHMVIQILVQLTDLCLNQGNGHEQLAA